MNEMFSNLVLNRIPILRNFDFLDSFSIKKREKLIEYAETILKNITNNSIRSDNQIKYLQVIQCKLMKKAQGYKISKLFLKIRGRGEELKELKQRTLRINQEIKNINKILKLDFGETKALPAYFDSDKVSKNLTNWIFTDHIYERMSYFGHPSKVNEKGELIFKFTQKFNLSTTITANNIEQNYNKPTYWHELHQDFIKKGYTLEIKGEYEKGRYQRFPVKELTVEKFKELILQKKDSLKDIQLLSHKQLNLKELEEKGVIFQDEETGEYSMSAAYDYLEDGFVKHHNEAWEFLKPYAYTSNPPKDFTLDIIVNCKQGLPGVFPNPGHASIKITTPLGEIYSVGLEPGEGKATNFRLQKGVLSSPDATLFFPLTTYENHEMSYTFSDAKTFHEIIKWIEGMQGYNVQEGNIETSNVFYHLSHHNCALFASSIRDYALKSGAKSKSLSTRKFSKSEEVGLKIKNKILNFILTSFIGKLIGRWDEGVEYAGIENYNIKHLKVEDVYLPVDLILEHQKLTDV